MAEVAIIHDALRGHSSFVFLFWSQKLVVLYLSFGFLDLPHLLSVEALSGELHPIVGSAAPSVVILVLIESSGGFVELVPVCRQAMESIDLSVLLVGAEGIRPPAEVWVLQK